ncbi:DUF736 domain-containing protein, partial [Sphingobium algorifonticola]
DLAAEMAPKTDDALPPLPGADDTAGAGAPAESGLGESSADHAFGAAPQEGQEGGRRKGRQRTPELAE